MRPVSGRTSPGPRFPGRCLSTAVNPTNVRTLSREYLFSFIGETNTSFENRDEDRGSSRSLGFVTGVGSGLVSRRKLEVEGDVWRRVYMSEREGRDLGFVPVDTGGVGCPRAAFY